MLDVPTIIEKAQVSQYLSDLDILKGVVFGRSYSKNLSTLLYCERKSIQWLYGQNPNDSSLQTKANYVNDLCGKYGLIAQGIINAASQGYSINYTTRSYIPITPPAPLEVKVGGNGPNDSKAPIAGQSVWALGDMAGYYVKLTRNKIIQVTDSTYDGTYYSKPLASNTLSIFPDTWQTGDDLMLEFFADPTLANAQQLSGGGSSNPFEIVNTKAQISSRTDTRIIIVLSDETNNGAKSVYMYAGGVMTQLITL